jgi:predicted Zn-dependent protease
LAHELKSQFATALTHAEIAGADDKEIKEIHKQFLTYLIMHEMGHTLGLNHNMKASQMLAPSELHNKTITRKLGLMGSVMDYPSINVSLDRTKQGDYITTKAGPYDLWAIEFGYTPFAEENEEAGISKILSRSHEPYLMCGNDGDDMRTPGRGIDTRVNVNDLSNDMNTFAEERFKLVNDLMGKLVKKYSKNGQSYAEVRSRYGMLLRQRMDMVSGLSRFVGGIQIDRSQPEQNSSAKPYTITPVAVQKKSIEVLSKYIFAPNAFDADAQVLPYLQRQRRGYDQGMGEDFKITNVASFTQSIAFMQLLHPNTLQRITNSRLYGNTYTITDVMNDLVKAIFDADIAKEVNVYRQYLQTNFVKNLCQLIDDKNMQTDDVAKAAIRNTIKKIKSKLATAVSTNEETKAHRNNITFIIDNALTIK